ncbi:MAG TPA: hypothetical protein PKN04_04435 [bacterium]|nr:hypothetical protein [bacterium]HNT65007.1 hypothetical protein [bacterium]HOX84414.1 hypothetical protein [bacterium]HPG45989.1 hypothetical protein [bacterium]HPM97811.1 hypothetical protein [bacterium]
MGLRIKVLSGFLILAIMMAIAGIWTIWELKAASFSVQGFLDENFRSISAADVMADALERQDSAILLLMLGKWQEGRQLLVRSDSIFTDRLAFAKSNITVAGEQACLDSIQIRYEQYRTKWMRPIVDTPRQGNIEWYWQEVHQEFLDVKTKVNELSSLNAGAMYHTASDLKQRSNRAVMPGLVAILAALLFTLIFNYYVNYYMVSPIIRITDRVKRFIENRAPYDVSIETKDEIAELSESIAQLCQISKSREKNR